MSEPPRRQPATTPNTFLLYYATMAYVAAALALDLHPASKYAHPSGFDYYKFCAWLAVPVLFSLPTLDARFFTFHRWKRRDVLVLAAMIAIGVAALALVPHIPQLSAIYPDQSHRPPEAKQALIRHYLIWDISWLPGWEFLHRYVLLRAAAARWPRYGWLLVPLAEGLYHLTKPPIEAAGMVVFSLLATYWALRRQNLLLPLIAHAVIEIGLLVVLFA